MRKQIINRCLGKLLFWWNTFIHNMRDNRKKHNILKILRQKKIEGDLEESPSLEVTDVGRSLTISKIHIITKYNIEEIKVLCEELVESKHVILIDYTQETQFLINSKGILAVLRKDFLGLIWYRSWDFWKWVAPLIIALTALLNGIFKWW